MKIRIFTDGACSENPGPGGWAAVFNSDKKCKSIAGNENDTTNNRMELKAVIESLKAILNMIGCEKHVFELYSDSAYVVNTINNCWLTKWQLNNWKTTKGDDVKNKDMWEELALIWHEMNKQNIKITIIKIKGHSGDTFNEMVDSLAKEQVMIAKTS